jgi:tetratricopeptide (TPR) repeat protein
MNESSISFVPRRWRALPAFMLVGALFLPAAAFGADDDSWVGRRIMPKRAGTMIGHTNGRFIVRQVYVAELTDLVYTVLREQGGWLLVRHRGLEDWFSKEQAVLLKDAIPYFAQRIREDSQDAFALAHRGRAWKEEGELEKALRDLHEAIRLNPNNSAWHSNRGMVYHALQEYDRAIRDYDEALRLDPGNVLSYHNRGRAYKAKKDYDQAIRDFGQALQLDSRLSEAYFNRGSAFKAKKNYDGAVGDYSQAIRLDPKWADAYFNRANVYKAKKDYDRAVSDFREVVRLDPRDADACDSLAWLLATCPERNVRDGKKAVEYATEACELTSWKESYFLGTLAAACAEIGEFDKAVRWQKKALESARYEREEGESARQRLRSFEDHKAYREE